MPTISVVVPCYRSGKNLPTLVQALHDELTELADRFEIIMVNDGSPDDTWERLQTITEQMPDIIAINLWRNFGQHNATLCGIQNAQYDIIVTIDDDLQYSPSEIPNLVKALESGFDLVYGLSREINHGIMRATASWAMRQLLALGGKSDYARVTSFRAFKSGLKGGLLATKGHSICIDSLLCWTTTKIGWVTVNRTNRAEGESGYDLAKLVSVTADLFLTDGTVPIKMLTLFGLLSLTASALSACAAWIIATSQLVFISIAAITFIASLQLMGVALILQYQTRLAQSLSGRQLYVEREIVASISNHCSAVSRESRSGG